jgi:hypothetical protein
VKSWYFLAVLVLLVPFGAMAADVQINGTCVVGTCPPPNPGPTDAIQFNGSVGPTPGSYNLLFGDGDAYTISWIFSASYGNNGTEVSITPTATYTGSSPSAGNDVINFDFFQNFYDNSPGSWDGSYTETVPLQLFGNVGAGSVVQAELFIDGQGLGLVGPYGVGDHFGSNTENLTGLDAATLSYEYEFNYDFQAGTQRGSTASSVPEPYETLPLLGVVLLVLAAKRRSAAARV